VCELTRGAGWAWFGVTSQVDGVYDKDPNVHADAVLRSGLSYQQVRHGLGYVQVGVASISRLTQISYPQVQC
jgi:uridylate kinase